MNRNDVNPATQNGLTVRALAEQISDGTMAQTLRFGRS